MTFVAHERSEQYLRSFLRMQQSCGPHQQRRRRGTHGAEGGVGRGDVCRRPVAYGSRDRMDPSDANPTMRSDTSTTLLLSG